MPIFEPEERPSTHSYIGLNGVRDYALEAHAGQLNRYTKVPNWKHLADIVHHEPDRARGGHLENMRLDIAVLTHGDEGLKVLVRNLWTAALRRLSSA